MSDCTSPSAHANADGSRHISRGLACAVPGCGHYAHTEWVQSLEDAPGSGVLTCECHTADDAERAEVAALSAWADGEAEARNARLDRTAGCDVCRIWGMSHPAGCGVPDPVTLVKDGSVEPAAGRSRNVLGLVAHNFLRHADARHGGRFDGSCQTCAAHLAHFPDVWASTVLETQRRIEG